MRIQISLLVPKKIMHIRISDGCKYKTKYIYIHPFMYRYYKKNSKLTKKVIKIIILLFNNFF
jgi:hypothetical protein